MNYSNTITLSDSVRLLLLSRLNGKLNVIVTIIIVTSRELVIRAV